MVIKLYSIQGVKDAQQFVAKWKSMDMVASNAPLGKVLGMSQRAKASLSDESASSRKKQLQMKRNGRAKHNNFLEQKVCWHIE